MGRTRTPSRRGSGGWKAATVLCAACAFLSALPAIAQTDGETCDLPEAAPAPSAAPATGAAASLERANRQASRGDYAAALAGYAESRRLAAAEGDARLELLSAANEARARIETGQLEGVSAELARVAAAAGDFGDARARAQLLLHVGRSYALLAARGAPGRDPAIRGAAGAFERAGEAARAAGDERLRAYALGYTADLYEEQGRREDALELTRRAILAAQSAESPDALYLQQWRLGRLEIAAGESERGLAAYRDAAASLAEIRTRVEPAFEHSADDFYAELVDLLLKRAASSRDEAERQRLLVEARDTLEDRKAAELRDYFRDPCLDAQRKETPDTVPNTVVLYPVLLPDRSELIVSREGRLASYAVPVGRDALTAEVRAFRKSLEHRTTREYLPHSDALYDLLIRPIEPVVLGSGAETLVVVPGGALRTIPFAALRDRESKQYLIEKIALAVTPSLTLTDPRPIESGRVRLLAAGISQAVGGYSELQAVVREIHAIRELYPGRTLMNQDFDVADFESALERVPFGIVHIASHGEFGGDTSDNFLLAYDGRISMRELGVFVGATRFRAEQPLELLTLSACESAAGNDRAALGLAGVALRAGARSALATLWSVNDRATADLVIEFYRQLHEPGHSRAQALQTAQVKMLHTRAYRHPGYWAPFLLINSWL